MTDMHGLKPNVWPNTPYNVTAQIRGDIREIVQHEIEQVAVETIGAETPAGAQAKVDAAALTLTAAIAAAKAELALVDDTKAALIHTHDDRYYLKSQVDAALSGKAPLVHDHALLYYTQAQVDAALAGKAGVVHGHNDLYYTEAEVDSALAGKSDAGHTHPGVYYTVAQADGLLATKAPLSHNHNTLYYSISQIDTALAGKAAAVHSHNDLYYTEAEVDALIAGVSSNAGWTPVNATTTTKGIVELATTTETTTGTDTTRAVTPAGVKAALDAKTVSDTSTYGRRLTTIYAADYCAEDGVTDDGPGLATAGAALVAAGGGRLVLTPGATYYMNTDTTITAPGIAVAVVADTEATIQLGPDAVSGLTITGTLTQLDGADAAYTATTVGDTTVTTASDLTGSLTAGDWVMIWSSDVDNAERAASYLSGEEAVVIDVDATTITLDRPVRLAHTAGATRRLYKFGMVRPTVRNIYIAASPTGVQQRPLSIYYGTDVQVDHVRVTGKVARYGIVVRQCVNVRLVRPEATDIWDATEATDPLGYGVSVEGGVNVTVVQPFGSRVRHVFDVGSYSTATIPGLVSHRVAVEDGSAAHTWAPAWSSHHAHGVVFSRCHATNCAGGLLVRSTGTVVRDCTVIGGHADKPAEWTAGRSTLTALAIGETVDLPAGEGPSGEDIVIDNLTVESLPSGWTAIKWTDAPGDRVSITGPDVPQDHTVVVSDSATRADGALGHPDNAYGSRPAYDRWEWLQGTAGVVIASNVFTRPTGGSTVGCRLNANVPADVEVSARWVTIGTPANSVCLTARASSAEANFYAAGIIADGTIAILKRTGGGGISSLVASAAGAVVDGDLVALRVVGRHITALVNGKIVVETDDTALTSGTAGWFFRSAGGDGWSASQFKVRDLTHAAT